MGQRRPSGGGKARGWLRTKANSIEGGTSEVMLNVISKRILDLPGVNGTVPDWDAVKWDVPI